MNYQRRTIPLAFCLPLLLSCYSELSDQTYFNSDSLAKINFDISRLSSEGLIGSSDGLRSLSYEFCIPKNESYLTEVKIIAPTLAYYSNTPGRIGCNLNQYLCIVSTHNPNWKKILFSIASLPYVERIDEFFAE